MRRQPDPYTQALAALHERVRALEDWRIRMEAVAGIGAIALRWGGPALVFLLLVTDHTEKAKVLVDLVK